MGEFDSHAGRAPDAWRVCTGIRAFEWQCRERARATAGAHTPNLQRQRPTRGSDRAGRANLTISCNGALLWKAESGK
jgi:hypothetical protein